MLRERSLGPDPEGKSTSQYSNASTGVITERLLFNSFDITSNSFLKRDYSERRRVKQGRGIYGSPESEFELIRIY